MVKQHKPRSGSMQFWPRKRAKKTYARIRSWAESADALPLAFAGYKVGMTHIIAIDNNKKATTAGMEIPFPVTVIECPPLKIASVRFYKLSPEGEQVSNEILVGKDKNLGRKLNLPKKKSNIDDVKPEEYDSVSIMIHTLPSKTGIGKKKPEVFEVKLGGNKEDQLKYVKENLDKEIRVSDIFKEGDMVDLHAVTKGYGTQGAVKRFGIGLKSHKSEKGRRRPGSLGGWKGQQHFMYRVPMAGQTGYHQRTQYNNSIFKIGDKPEEVNVKGGYKGYGEVKNDYILIKGSVQGPSKRLVIFTRPIREPDQKPIPSIQYISTESKQGR